jgi:hypothetical protein
MSTECDIILQNINESLIKEEEDIPFVFGCFRSSAVCINIHMWSYTNNDFFRTKAVESGLHTSYYIQAAKEMLDNALLELL